MVLEARTLEQVLFLTGGVLCTDLLTVDALHRHAFVVFCKCVETHSLGQLTEVELVTVMYSSNVLV